MILVSRFAELLPDRSLPGAVPGDGDEQEADMVLC